MARERAGRRHNLVVVARLASIDLRKRVAATLTLALVIGLVLGVVLAALAGARRNATAYERMLRATGASDLLVNPNFGTDSKLDPDRVAKLPQAEAMGMVNGLLVVGDRNGEPDFQSPDTDSTMVMVGSRGYASDIDRPIIEAGRVPRDDTLDELAMSPDLAERKHLRIGSTLVLHVFTVDQARQAATRHPPKGRVIRPRVVGLLQDNYGVVTDDATPTSVIMLGGKARELNANAYYGLALRLRHGAADVAAVEAAVSRMVPVADRANGDTMVFQTRTDLIGRVHRIVGPQTTALTAFGLVLGIAALGVAAQAITRHLAERRADVPTLRAIGATRRMIYSLLMVRAAAIAVVAAIAALAVAAALSPLAPVGLARTVEPHRGIAVNLAVLLPAAAVFVGLVLAVVALPVWRTTSARTEVALDRPSVWSKLVPVQTRPTVALGTRNALGGARGVGSSASAVVGISLAVVWLVAAGVFAESLTTFVDTPSAWGWHWNAMVSLNTDDNAAEGLPPDARQEVAAILRRTPNIRDVSLGTTTELTLGGRPVTTVAMTPTAKGMPATISEGTYPRRAGEVALGVRTMHKLHASIGSTVRGTDQHGEPYRMKVVGQAVFPGLASYPGEDPTSLGSGALVTMGASERYGAPLSGATFFVDAGGPLPRATLAALHRARVVGSGEPGVSVIYQQPQQPSDVKGAVKVRNTPYLLAGLLGVLALLTVGHTLLTDVRRRRRELAICKVVGFTRRQVASVVAWHATTVTAIGLLVGVPLGIAVGRAAWDITARQLGIVPSPVVPVALVLLVAAGILLAANLVAAVPGQLAARIPAAEVLQQE